MKKLLLLLLLVGCGPSTTVKTETNSREVVGIVIDSTHILLPDKIITLATDLPKDSKVNIEEIELFEVTCTGQNCTPGPSSFLYTIK